MFVCSCASRQWVAPESFELDAGATIYRLVTDEADTISFAGTSVEDIEQNILTGEAIYRFNGSGAAFCEGEIKGVSFDGTETAIDIRDVALFEIDKHNTVRTVLFTTGILTASGFLLYTIIKGFTEEEPALP